LRLMLLRKAWGGLRRLLRRVGVERGGRKAKQRNWRVIEERRLWELEEILWTLGLICLLASARKGGALVSEGSISRSFSVSADVSYRPEVKLCLPSPRYEFRSSF
jgi:hypothetical protein